jgi:class 3 adenylate cyclase/energy-coupling factor transporter ATP-binding protein EcfA2
MQLLVNFQTINIPTFAMADKITKWLDGLGLGLYAATFAAQQVDYEILPELTDEDLKELDIPLGPRKKLLKAIAHLEPESKLPGGPIGGSASPSGYKEAERRQLTVMFCDLVGSTELSRNLDPEDLRNVNRSYQDACKVSIERYEGYVARYMGDGVLAYFGWPQAHEDDAERAVHSGLALVDTMVELNKSVGTKYGITLTVRVGIATGPVVVGDLIGDGASQESAVVGETPNLAARFQSAASPDTVVIGQVTQGLTGGRFECEDLGAQSIKGFAEPVHTWRVVAPTSTQGRFESTHSRGITPLVGRKHELALMGERWQRATGGEGQIVLLTGEAGIGKSRLLSALKELIGDEPHVQIDFQCSPYHTNSAFHPITRHLEGAAGITPGEDVSARLDKLSKFVGGDDLDCAAVATLMSLPIESLIGSIEITPLQLKIRAYDVLWSYLRGLADKEPVLLVFEDLHWIDPSSQEFLNKIVTALADTRLLCVMTYRTEYQAPFLSSRNVTALMLPNLGRADIEEMVDAVAERHVGHELLKKLVAQTDGIPLFVEEMTKSVIESAASNPEVPATLHASLLSRLDRLGEAKEIAQIGAVIGRDFDYGLLEIVAERDPDELAHAISRLVDASLVFQSGVAANACYSFKHALVQEAAYNSLLKSRLEVLHGRIASALEQGFPEIAVDEPEILARHHTAAGNTDPAIEYWRLAGKRAYSLSSGAEACSHFEHSISLLETLPPSHSRDAVELPIRLAHAGALQLTRGPADTEVGRNFSRSLELSERVGEPAQRVAPMFGMWRHHVWRSGANAGSHYADGLWSIAGKSNNMSDRVLANYVMSANQMVLGNEKTAAEHARVAWESFSSSTRGVPNYHLGHNQGVSSLLILAWSLWGLGQPALARSTIAKGLAEAEALSEPLTLTLMRVFAAAIYELLGEEKQDNLDACRAIARKYGFTVWSDYADTCLGWLKHRAGESKKGLELMERGIEALQRADYKVFMTDRLALYGRMCLETGHLSRARHILTDAEQLAEETGEKFWLTEIHRYLGRLSLAENGERGTTERYFRLALSAAETREAFGFALRAAIDLARHLRQDGRIEEAKQTLSGVYAHFKASDDTSDLRTAKAMLEDFERAQVLDGSSSPE